MGFSISLSIIVPMYKVVDYVTRCIESLENQDIDKSDYEIICINDGSPDNCKEVVEELQRKFTNIVLINQDNQGVSMARNNGIALAKGKYILPIDPDDYLLPHTLGKLVARAENQALDVLYLGFEIFNASGKSIWQTDYSEQENTIYCGVEGYFASRGFGVRDPDRSVAVIYLKELLDTFDIKYPQNVPYLEDGLFLAKVFAVAKKVGFSNKKFYQRTTRMGSATNSKLFYSEKAIQGFLLAVQNIKQFESAHVLTGEQKGLINHVIAKFVLLPLTSIIGARKFSSYMKLVKQLNRNGLKKVSLEGLRMDYLKLVKIYNFSPFLFFIYYPVYVRAFKNY
jgi:glycosyltransferase involved in cell wall biosynthesis